MNQVLFDDQLITIIFLKHTAHEVNDRNMPQIIKDKIDSYPINLTPNQVLTDLLRTMWPHMTRTTPKQVYRRFNERRNKPYEIKNGYSDFDMVKEISGKMGVEMIDCNDFFILDLKLELEFGSDVEGFIDGYYGVETSNMSHYILNVDCGGALSGTELLFVSCKRYLNNGGIR